MSKKATPVADVPDENEGHGGSYVINPDTNKRELVERTMHQNEVSKESEAKNGSVKA